MSIFRSSEHLYRSKVSCDRHEWFRIYFTLGVLGFFAMGIWIKLELWLSSPEWLHSPAQFRWLDPALLGIASCLFLLMAVRKMWQEYNDKS